MRLLVIGTDRAIFEAETEARRRIEAYARLFDELDIIVYTPPGFRAVKVGANLRVYPTNSLLYFMRPFDALRIARGVASQQRIDLVSVQDPAESGLAGLWLKWASGVPLHVQIHADIFSPFFRKNSWKERLRWFLALFVIPRGDGFRVVSQRTAESLRSRIKSQELGITVLPIFVDREKIALSNPAFNLRDKYHQFDFIILMVARLVREKNMILALESFSAMLKEFPASGLVVVGDGPEEESLKFKVRSLKLAESVCFEGWRKDVLSYYKTADLYLLTSNFEGYARSVIEAAAAGLPVVMTDVGVAGEIIWDSETGRVVPVGDKSALIRALLDARMSPTRSKEMAKKAQQLVLSLPPQKWEEYLKAYKSSFSF